ncbi:MAG: hypothetical protein CVV64_07525 [Candidatus Wallbacteria bacterium HGW-Wallbacteria-1]|jgi:ABC-type transport system involved in multi-copper enzyme maturation permease subunit|uniref:ABC transporter permease n=1 Tax=Candidatus Wallbacteria bacterium HGW-Wallbacteria-1 TaxID=2013854 RepID=A0A2N1PQW1_9BACT|nr:MAG: hypothetical protein CVV64_07525 [Candidatus Wallbacteria bacterium HGW-Wallbacteria-1]
MNTNEMNTTYRTETGIQAAAAITTIMKYEIKRCWKITALAILSVYTLKFIGNWLGGDPTPAEMAGNGLSFLLLIAPLITVYLFSGSLAFERQRGTLTLFVTSSISRKSLVAGKLISEALLVLIFFLLTIPACTPGQTMDLSWLPELLETYSDKWMFILSGGFFIGATAIAVSAISSGPVAAFILSGLLIGGILVCLASLSPRDGFTAALVTTGTLMSICAFRILGKGDITDQKKMFAKAMPVLLTIIVGVPFILSFIIAWRDQFSPPSLPESEVIMNNGKPSSPTFFTGLKGCRYMINTYRKADSLWDIPLTTWTGALNINEIRRENGKNEVTIVNTSLPAAAIPRHNSVQSLSPDRQKILMEAIPHTLGFFSRLTELFIIEADKKPVSLGKFNNSSLTTWTQDNTLLVCQDTSSENGRRKAHQNRIYRFMRFENGEIASVTELKSDSISGMVGDDRGSILICSMNPTENSRKWMLFKKDNGKWEEIGALSNHDLIVSDALTGRFITMNNSGEYFQTDLKKITPEKLDLGMNRGFRLKGRNSSSIKFTSTGLIAINRDEADGEKFIVICRYQNGSRKVSRIRVGDTHFYDTIPSANGERIVLLASGNEFNEILEKSRSYMQTLNNFAPVLVSHHLSEKFWKSHFTDVRILESKVENLPDKGNLIDSFTEISTIKTNQWNVAGDWIAEDSLAIAMGSKIFEVNL